MTWAFVRFAFVDFEKNTVWIVPQIRAITYLIDPAFVVLITWLCLLKAPKINLKYRYLLLFSLATILIFSFSIVANLEVIKWGNVSKFAIGYLRFIPIILFSIIYLCKKDNLEVILYNVIKLSVCLMLLNGIINTLWFLNIQLFRNIKILIPNNPDWAYGLMENTTLFAICNSILMAFAYFKANYAISRKKKYFYYALLIFSLLQVVWSESKVSFLVLPISLIITLVLLDDSFKFKKILAPIAMFFLVLIAASFFYAERAHFRDGGVSKIDLVTSIVQKTWSYNPKILFIKSLLYEIPSKENVPILGGGPGSVASKFALDSPTRLSAPYFVKYTEQNFLFGNSVITSPRIGIAAIYGDLGVLGFFSYFGMWLYIFLKVLKAYKRNTKFLSNRLKVVYQVWLSLFLTFFANIIFIDSLYIGAPILILTLLVPPLISDLGKKEKLIDASSKI